MGYRGHLYSLLVVVFSVVIGSSEAYQFNVGGKEGWVLNPSENYNHWAERLRFQVNDTLFFKYKKESDSVLIVSKQDYDTCNTQKPITKLDGGDSIFKFDRSGPFYFITGNKTNCDYGQKLIIVVLAVRNAPPKSPPSPPTSSPSYAPSETRSPAPAPGPVSQSKSPSSSFSSPAPAPGPGSQSKSPSSSFSPPAPAAGPGSQSKSPSSSFSPPAPDAPGPGGGTENINSTAPPHGIASVFRPSTASYVIVLLLTVCFG